VRFAQCSTALAYAPGLFGLAAHVAKFAVSGILDKMADAGKTKPTIETVMILIHELFRGGCREQLHHYQAGPQGNLAAVRRVRETRSLDEADVRRIFECTSGQTRLICRILLLTGCRIGQLLALRKDDLLPEGLCIDESAFERKAADTKDRKTRIAP
jgi:integrase